MQRVVGEAVSPNTIERISLEVGSELEEAESQQWESVLTGEVVVPELAIVEFDGGRIRTRKEGCGPGVHLSSKGWNETKNAIFVSASSSTSDSDPEPEPPECFLNADHVAQLADKAKTKEKQGANDDFPEDNGEQDRKSKRSRAPHKPKRVLRTVISSLKNSQRFGEQMAREARRRRFNEASRKAFVADGLTCNWTIHQKHFADYTPILDFVHAVTYLYRASLACFGELDSAWSAYCGWMRAAWQGNVEAVIIELHQQQERIGPPDEDANEEDPREQLRKVIGYLQNN
ncbi:MAG: hypothetical protein AAF497_28940, partial [Planctomycetota bacterium]